MIWFSAVKEIMVMTIDAFGTNVKSLTVYTLSISKAYLFHRFFKMRGA